MKVKITEMHPKDGFYKERKKIIGSIGEFAYAHDSYEEGFLAGEVLMPKEIVLSDRDKKSLFYFYAIKVEQCE